MVPILCDFFSKVRIIKNVTQEDLPNRLYFKKVLMFLNRFS